MDCRMSSPIQEPPPAISPRIESAYLKAYSNSQESSDRVYMTCGDHGWTVHRHILSSKSIYFEEPDYDDRDRHAEIKLDSKDDPDMITRLLTWCYGGEYLSQPGKENAEDCSPGQKAIIDAKLYKLAAKYAFTDLKTATCIRLGRHLAKAVNNMPADEDTPRDKTHDIYYILEAVQLAYASGDPDPRYYVMDALRHYHSVLLNSFLFGAFVKEGGDLALDVLKEWGGANNSLEYICRDCAYKAKYRYDESRTDVDCACCRRKMGSYLKAQPVKNYY